MSVGVDLPDVPPLPNWPSDPYPQHDITVVKDGAGVGTSEGVDSR